eukprot:GHVS01052248.1.p1 GENE.GHVS01052248.1~~GHVS01052248.1.p1  ORF type:complete len:415 (+),score=96.05 GHVS01052248.1:259-1503(+)
MSTLPVGNAETEGGASGREEEVGNEEHATTNKRSRLREEHNVVALNGAEAKRRSEGRCARNSKVEDIPQDVSGFNQASPHYHSMVENSGAARGGGGMHMTFYWGYEATILFDGWSIHSAKEFWLSTVLVFFSCTVSFLLKRLRHRLDRRRRRRDFGSSSAASSSSSSSSSSSHSPYRSLKDDVPTTAASSHPLSVSPVCRSPRQQTGLSQQQQHFATTSPHSTCVILPSLIFSSNGISLPSSSLSSTPHSSCPMVPPISLPSMSPYSSVATATRPMPQSTYYGTSVAILPEPYAEEAGSATNKMPSSAFSRAREEQLRPPPPAGNIADVDLGLAPAASIRAKGREWWYRETTHFFLLWFVTFLAGCIDWSLMLVCMTFNAGLFLAVVAAYATGVLVFGRTHCGANCDHPGHSDC